jgi:hypothetical protein
MLGTGGVCTELNWTPFLCVGFLKESEVEKGTSYTRTPKSFLKIILYTLIAGH